MQSHDINEPMTFFRLHVSPPCAPSLHSTNSPLTARPILVTLPNLRGQIFWSLLVGHICTRWPKSDGRRLHHVSILASAVEFDLRKHPLYFSPLPQL